MKTQSQRIAYQAYSRVENRRLTQEYISFARAFPTLIHSCGLAQAVEFARAKGGHQVDYANDLSAVLQAVGYPASGADELADAIRTNEVIPYLRMSRDALAAADWLKRYVDAAEKAQKKAASKPGG